ncbi:hypothetical protein AA15669_1639 [Saccharibacter floricola DSM 15669]|uniref:Uncharacterized protein n=1 Tax=Saccharibacter floricola DSM 15669 TaxID=1123227 RepID=A0ABQ0P154_9PROT|nr:hypothetical protein AA15669_1639 [Saccharibacter floricola DSM 15669]
MGKTISKMEKALPVAKRDCTPLQLAGLCHALPSLESYELENNPPDMQKPRFFKRG